MSFLSFILKVGRGFTLWGLVVLAGDVHAEFSQRTPVRNASGLRGAVATVHPIASDIAVQVLKEGGNAIDAAVAAGLALGVVDGFNSGIGGGCFLLVRTKDGVLLAIDGREKAPAAAHRDLFLEDGKAVPERSQTGALAIGVPGALAAYDLVLRGYGSKSLADVIAPSAKVAREGFVLSKDYASRLKSATTKLNQFPASAATFLKADGEPLQAGEVLKQADLAETYEAIGRDGIGYFYEGRFAALLAAWMKENGGILTEADMADYECISREPIRTSYRGYEIVGFPPPSSGGVHVAQMLTMLEAWDLSTMADTDRRHVVAETMKLAFADRAHWLGDSDFARVPRGLISKGYAATLNAKIDLKRAATVEGHGTPEASDTDVFGRHTTHFCVADADGNWVSCTQTINTTFGSGVVVPGTGVPMNNEMDDFAAQPGVANFFGLLGAEANSVAPGKRPLSSMSPTIVLQDGQPVFAIGAAGGPTIITQVLQGLINRLDLKLSLSESISRPRLHHQWAPDQLLIEPSLEEATQNALKAKGHILTVRSGIGVSQALVRHPDGRLEAQAETRLDSSAARAF